ncbi:uncharacterized protein RHOBADRAFT_66619, partial [Rhodotorula graminis WP1]
LLLLLAKPHPPTSRQLRHFSVFFFHSSFFQLVIPSSTSLYTFPPTSTSTRPPPPPLPGGRYLDGPSSRACASTRCLPSQRGPGQAIPLAAAAEQCRTPSGLPAYRSAQGPYLVYLDSEGARFGGVHQ